MPVCSPASEHRSLPALPPFAPTVVGSFPHLDGEALVETILRRLPELPAWPQLPGRGVLESMYAQCCEGLPGAVVDLERQRVFFRADQAFASELESFYQAVVEADVERFAIGRERALGLHLFIETVERAVAQAAAGTASGAVARPAWLKGQLSGPFSFAMTVTDENKRALAYTPELYEVAVQGMALKARWMARSLRRLADGVLITLDEPYLCSFGSAFVNVAREEVQQALASAAAAVHAEGALCGLHCCGNTDWSLVLAAEVAVDLISFDAHDYFTGLSLYPDELRAFLERGGIIAWGLVPTAGAGWAGEIGGDGGKLAANTVAEEAERLLRMLDRHIEQLTAKGLPGERLRRQSLVTPSCGMGSRTVAEAERILDLLTELAGRLRARQEAR